MAHPVLATLGLVSVALIGAGLWLRAAPDADVPFAVATPGPAATAEARDAAHSEAPAGRRSTLSAQNQPVAEVLPNAPAATVEAPLAPAAPPDTDEADTRHAALAEDPSTEPATAEAPLPYYALPGVSAETLLPPPAAPAPGTVEPVSPDPPLDAKTPPTSLTAPAPSPGKPVEEIAIELPPELPSAPAPEAAAEAATAAPSADDAGFAPVTYGPATQLHPVVSQTVTVMEYATFEREFRALSPAPYFGAVAFEGPRAVVGAGGYASLDSAEAAVLARCLQLAANCRIGARYLPAGFDARRGGTLSHHQSEVWDAFRTDPLLQSPVIDLHRAFAWSDDGAAVAFDMIGEEAARSMALLRCDAARRQLNRPPVPGAEGCRIGAMRSE